MSHVTDDIFLKIIGVGSPIGDDDIGWKVIDALSVSHWLQPWLGRGVGLISLDRPGVSLLEEMSGVDQVVMVDAMVSGKEPGTVAHFEWPFSIEESAMLSSHGFGVREALELGQVLGTLPAKLGLWGVEIRPSNGAGEQSCWTKDQISKILQPIEKELQSMLDREIVRSGQR